MNRFYMTYYYNNDKYIIIDTLENISKFCSDMSKIGDFKIVSIK